MDYLGLSVEAFNRGGVAACSLLTAEPSFNSSPAMPPDAVALGAELLDHPCPGGIVSAPLPGAGGGKQGSLNWLGHDTGLGIDFELDLDLVADATPAACRLAVLRPSR